MRTAECTPSAAEGPTLPRMTVRTSAARDLRGRYAGGGAITALWVVLALEVALGVILAIVLSLLAEDQRASLGEEAGVAAETSIRFAAGGAFVFAIAALTAALAVRRRRRWAWTLGVILQLVLAIGTGIALLALGGEGVSPGYLIGFAVAGLAMLLLSTGQVRRALGQA